MTLVISHAFVSGKADGVDPTLVQPSNWNAALSTSMATGKILGRATAGAGVIEELSVSGSGPVAMTASPTFTGTANFSAITMGGSINMGGQTIANCDSITCNVSVSNIAGARDQSNYGWYVSGFGDHCQLETQRVSYTYGAFGGFVNVSDGDTKTVLADHVDYRAGVKKLWAGEFLAYGNREKSGVPHPGFGIIAQQAHAALGDFVGIVVPETPGEVWKATQEPWAFLALKVLSGALAEIDELKAEILALKAKAAP